MFHHTVVSSEPLKTRLAVVISNDTANAVLNRIQVIPVSSQIAHLYPAEAYVPANVGRQWPASSQRLVSNGC
jgi:mRNA interferase MazF